MILLSAMPTAAAEPAPQTTLLLAGGGLANGLIAYRLSQLRPDVRVLLVEGGARLGGRHTWSFFASDLEERGGGAWIEPFVVRSWSEYEVRFPGRRRRIRNGYRSVTSERLHDLVAARLGAAALLSSPIARLEPGAAVLEDGRRFEADVVVDGRGPAAMPDLVLGFQKFLGLTLRLAAPHGLKGPVIMDATVAQRDGYRFIYTLPWDERRVLVEDTRYSDGDQLGRDELRAAVLAYARQQGWRVEAVEEEEEGVLPVALEGDIEAHWRRAEGMALAGLRAVLFHPTTGYSLPDAVALADEVCALPVVDQPSVERLVRDRSIRLWEERGIFRLVNRMLFRAAEPQRRYRVLERFYGLPEPLIRRFYAARLTRLDKVRLLTGRPPVPFGAALACISERPAL